MKENNMMVTEAEEVTPKATEPVIYPLDYVTIPVKEYRKLIKKAEKLKRRVQKEHNEMMIYWRQVNETKKHLEDAKAEIRKLIGLEDKERLADLQFEKGVKTDA